MFVVLLPLVGWTCGAVQKQSSKAVEASASFCYSVTPVWTPTASAVHPRYFPGSPIMLVSAILVTNICARSNGNQFCHHAFQGVSLKPLTDQRLMSWSIYQPLYPSYKHNFNLLSLWEAAPVRYCFDLAISLRGSCAFSRRTAQAASTINMCVSLFCELPGYWSGSATPEPLRI